MIKIVIPVSNVDDAIAVRDRIRGIILIEGETASIVDTGVAISTKDPVRVCMELERDGFF